MGITLTVGDQDVTLSVQAAGATLSTYIPGPAGPEGPAGASTFDLQTNSSIGGNRAVTTAGGYAIYADNTDEDKFAVGISTGAVDSGDDVTVQSGGKMTVTGAGWTVGGLVYLSTNGTLTQTEPSTGISQVLGVAHSADVIIIEIRKQVILA